MRIEATDPALAKGWYWGPWNTDLAISVGFANTGVDEPHLHFVVQVPGLQGKEARADKIPVPRSSLGL